MPTKTRQPPQGHFWMSDTAAVARTGTRLLAYCVMGNHWHLVVWPRQDGELSQFVGWLTVTRTQCWHAFRQSTGSGHVYQGRFKSFPVQEDEHLFTVARYVERNALRANLKRRAEHWRWCSLYRWLRDSADDRRLLAAWPSPRPACWTDRVNAPQTEAASFMTPISTDIVAGPSVEEVAERHDR